MSKKKKNQQYSQVEKTTTSLKQDTIFFKGKGRIVKDQRKLLENKNVLAEVKISIEEFRR